MHRLQYLWKRWKHNNGSEGQKGEQRGGDTIENCFDGGKRSKGWEDTWWWEEEGDASS